MVKEAACIALNVRNNYLKRSLRAFSIIGSTKEEISPPIEAISRTKVEDKKENLALGVKKTLSKSGDIALFIFANWNSYSKSDTALNPRISILEFSSLAKSTTKPVKPIALTFLLPLNICSTWDILSSKVNTGFLDSLVAMAMVTSSNK